MTDFDGPSEGASDHSEPAALAGIEGQLLLDLEGFEGPIDLLLSLARDQKVDITKISILALADQYLLFIAAAQRISLEIAADYLVMAAWLAYLKSRLLLPDDDEEEQPSGAQMAEALAFQLRRLESMQEAGVRLFARPMLGRDVFRCGAPQGTEVIREAVFEPSLYELLKAYGQIQSRGTDATPAYCRAGTLFGGAGGRTPAPPARPDSRLAKPPDLPARRPERRHPAPFRRRLDLCRHP